MSYLVTGGAGFIGSHVAKLLLKQGKSVVVLDNFNDYYSPALKRRNIDGMNNDAQLTLVEGDIRNADLMKRVFNDHDITHVAHMAAMAGVRGAVNRTSIYMDVNVTGTMNLLEAAAAHKVKIMVQASTSSVYGETLLLPFIESDAADRPLTAYAASKRAAEILSHTYHRLNGLNITVLRFFNVYGPAGRPDMMPLRLMNAALDGTVIKVFNEGNIHRDWTYIEDTAAGVVAALERPMGYEIINLGCGDPISLRDFIDVIEEYSGRTIKTESVPTPPSDPPITYCNNEKAQRLLGFQPKVDVREGLLHTWNWFREIKGL